MRAQRWEWTHRYGMPLFMASVVSVILAGSSLIAVVALTGDPGDQPNPPPAPPAPPTAPPPAPPASPVATPDPTPSPPAPVADVDPDCVIGTWTAVQLADEGITGTWTLIGGEPTFEYRADGRGTIDYGTPETGNGTTFEFEDLLGGTSDSVPSGRTQFQYSVVDHQVRHIYDVFNAARMLSIPYVPSEDVFAGTCEDDTMILDGENGFLELRRR